MTGRKRLVLLVSVCLVMQMLLCIPAIATPIVYVNGEQLVFDVAPTYVDERLVVPVRLIFEKLGATVEWDDYSQRVTAKKGKTIIVLTVNNKTAMVNDNPVPMDVAATMISNRVMVPLRFVSESLGCNVDWIASTETVNITSQAVIPTVDDSGLGTYNNSVTETESNEQPATANTWNHDQVMLGTIGSQNDVDWFIIPKSNLLINSIKGQFDAKDALSPTIEVMDWNNNPVSFTVTKTGNTVIVSFSSPLPANQYYIRVKDISNWRTSNEYRYALFMSTSPM